MSKPKYKGTQVSWDKDALREIYREDNIKPNKYTMREMAEDFKLNLTTIFRVLNSTEPGIVSSKKWVPGNVKNLKRKKSA